MFSQQPLVCIWGKWVTEIKCFDQDQRRGVGVGENLLWIKKTKREKLCWGEWNEHRERWLLLLGL